MLQGGGGCPGGGDYRERGAVLGKMLREWCPDSPTKALTQ